jgi:multiple sugar transport system permease protein
MTSIDTRPAAVAATKVDGVRRPRRRRTPAWGFLAPYLALLVLFGIAPAIYGLYQAFIVTPVVGPPEFSLWQNFADVIGDYRLPPSALHVLLYLAIWLPLELVVVFGLALLLDAKRTRFAALTRFVAYVPGAITGSAAALLWLFMFSPVVSPIGPLLTAVAHGSTFLSDQTLPIVLAVMGIAAGAGGWIVVLYGALTAIPHEVIESAVIDGASPWQVARLIKLPLIRGYVVFILVVSIAQGFQVFVEPTVLAGGATGQISRTWSINQLAYSYATDQSNYGRAAALSILLLVVCVGLAVLIIKRTNFYRIGDR